MATYTDDFNRADNSSLGSPWVESESFGDALQIGSNRIGFLGSGRNALGYWNDSFANNQYAQLVLKSVYAEHFNGPAVRVSGTYTDATMYAAGYLAGNKIELRKWVGQTVGSQGTLLGSYSVTLSIDDILRIEAEGTTIRVKRNGAMVIEVTDASIASGKAGVVVTSPTGATWWDDWASGDIETPPPPAGGFHHQVMQV